MLFRFRNTLKWALGNLASAPFEPMPREGMEEPELWMLAKLEEVGDGVREDAARLDFGGMARRLERFCAGDLSSFWFNMRKDSLYCDRPDSPVRAGVATALARVLDHLARWLAPLVPFTAEEAWLEANPGGGASTCCAGRNRSRTTGSGAAPALADRAGPARHGDGGGRTLPAGE